MPILPTRAPSASDSPPSPVPRPQLKFNDQNDNFHRVEFDAPSSSSPQPLSKGRFSIDLSIELERELATMESPPDTPNNIGLRTGEVDQETNANGMTPQGNESGETHQHEESLLPDPEVLSHIVTQLRLSLASLTQERDTLVLLLAKKTDEEASAKDALEAMVERVTNAEEELGEARRKVKEGEEQIGLLRGKVEESRRGLMRLQTENRRQSTMLAPIDVNRASALTFGNGPLTSASAKRASFTPLTGSRHGRVPSASDIHHLGVDANGVLLPSPIATSFSNGEAGLSQNLSHSGNGTRRISGLFGRHSPSEHDGSVASDHTTPHPISSEVQQELESLKAEVKSLKSELESAKRDVVEANEAREASETCVQALRGFIKENGVGIRAETVEQGGVKSAPSTPMMVADGEDGMRTTTSATTSGWGFTKLWGSSLGPGTTTNSTSIESSTITKPSSSPSLPSATAPAAASTSAAPLLSRKLTGLFGSRSARSSGSSVQSPVSISSALPAPSPPNMLERRDSTSMMTSTASAGASTGSDVSSVIEPISPALSGSGLALGVGFGAKFGPGKVHEIPMEINGHVDGIEKGIETPVLSLHEIELDEGGLR